MKIGLIGAGKVGFSLGKYFKTRGIEISGYFSRTPDHAKQAADFTGTTWYPTVEPLVEESDALFLTVPDGAIEAAWRSLPMEAVKGKMICHCSGALTARETFPGIERTGASGYSVHPLFAFSSRDRCWEELSDVFFCVEGDAARLKELTALLRSCGNPVQVLSPESKVRYHAAAAIASNHVVALAEESLRLMERCGFDRAGALRALRPILLGNMAHLAEYGPAASLTGPVERCDTETVRRHLAALPTEEDRQLYALLSQRLVRIAEEKHPERTYQPMTDLLKGD